MKKWTFIDKEVGEITEFTCENAAAVDARAMKFLEYLCDSFGSGWVLENYEITEEEF